MSEASLSVAPRDESQVALTRDIPRPQGRRIELDYSIVFINYYYYILLRQKRSIWISLWSCPYLSNRPHFHFLLLLSLLWYHSHSQLFSMTIPMLGPIRRRRIVALVPLECAFLSFIRSARPALLLPSMACLSHHTIPYDLVEFVFRV